MKGTRLNDFQDLEVQKDEHVLIALEDAQAAFNEYSFYTQKDIKEKLGRVDAYTTMERVAGMKAMASIKDGEGAEHAFAIINSSVGDLVKRVQIAESDKRHDEWTVKLRERQYSRVKQRLHIVKTENTNLRVRIGELEELVVTLERECEQLEKEAQHP